MPENATRKYITKIDYVAGIVGADVARDVLKVALAFQDANADPIKVQDNRIPVPLQQDNGGAIYIVLKTDNIGLAKSSDISGLKGSQNKDFTTLEADVESAVTKLTSIDGKVATETTLSAINTKVATETTLSGIKTQTDKMQFDSRNLLKIYMTDDQIQLVDRTTTTDEFIPSGVEVAFGTYTIGTGLTTRVDGRLVAKRIVADGRLVVNGRVEGFE